MGVSSYGVCLLNKPKDIPEIKQKILDRLASFLQQNEGWIEQVNEYKELNSERIDYFSIFLTFKNEKRQLYIFFSDTAINDYPGKSKVTWSLSCYGAYETLMKCVASVMFNYGVCLWDRSDSDDQGYEPFDPVLSVKDKILRSV